MKYECPHCGYVTDQPDRVKAVGHACWKKRQTVDLRPITHTNQPNTQETHT